MHYNSNSLLHLLSTTHSTSNIQQICTTIIIIMEQDSYIIFLTTTYNVVNIIIFTILYIGTIRPKQIVLIFRSIKHISIYC